MTKQPKLDALTSLRFFAAAMIVIGHTHPLFGSAGIAKNFSLAQGVSFFFVLSGFILKYNYSQLKDWHEVKRFFVARFARIYPSHIAAIALFLLLTGGLNLGGLDKFQAVFVGFLNLFLLQSLVPLKDVFLTYNGVAWSISTEFCFYLVFPLLIGSFIGGRIYKLMLLIAVVFAFLCFAVLWQVSADEGSTQFSLLGLLYVNPLVRVIEFYIGVLACDIFLKWQINFEVKKTSNIKSNVIEIFIVFLTILSLWLTPRLVSYLHIGGELGVVLNYYFTKSGSALIFALLIMVFASNSGMFSRFISGKIFVLLGEVSFALYLVHMSALIFFKNFIGRHPDINIALQILLFWSISLLLAWALHKLVETPFRKLILRFYDSRHNR